VMNKVIDEFMRLAPWLRQSEKLLWKGTSLLIQLRYICSANWICF
jgi:hypothetical protein